MTAVLERPEPPSNEPPICGLRPGVDKQGKKKPKCKRTKIKVGTPDNWAWFCPNCDQLAKTPYEHLNKLEAA